MEGMRVGIPGGYTAKSSGLAGGKVRSHTPQNGAGQEAGRCGDHYRGPKFGPTASNKTSPVHPDHGFKLATTSRLDKRGKMDVA